MRNYDIIKKVFKITQTEINGDYYDREHKAEELIFQIQGLIANERPEITGSKWKQKESGIDY